MKKTFSILAAVLLLLAAALFTGCEFRETLTLEEQKAKFGSPDYLMLDVTYPFDDADNIIAGTVVRVTQSTIDQYTDMGTLGFTADCLYQTVRVDEVFKGDLQVGDEISIASYRDEIYRMSYRFFESGGYLQKGEKAIIFTSSQEDYYVELAPMRCYIQEDGSLLNRYGYEGYAGIDTLSDFRESIQGLIAADEEALRQIAEERESSSEQS